MNLCYNGNATKKKKRKRKICRSCISKVSFPLVRCHYQNKFSKCQFSLEWEKESLLPVNLPSAQKGTQIYKVLKQWQSTVHYSTRELCGLRALLNKLMNTVAGFRGKKNAAELKHKMISSSKCLGGKDSTTSYISCSWYSIYISKVQFCLLCDFSHWRFGKWAGEMQLNSLHRGDTQVS